MYVLLLALVSGMVVGHFVTIRGGLARHLDRLSTVLLLVILGAMGAKLAGPKVLASLALIGARAAGFAAGTVSGSVILGWLVLTALARARRRPAESVISSACSEEA